MKFVQGSLICLAAIAIFPFPTTTLARDQPIRIGIYENPPKSSIKNGQPSGFFGELTLAIAEAESWDVVFVICEWPSCLDLLEQGDLDLMIDVSYSQLRDQKFDFNHEVVFKSWSQIYTRRGVELHSILDLDHKKIAVLENGIQFEALTQIAQDTRISPEIIGVDDYFEMENLLHTGQVDAGVFNRFSATKIKSRRLVQTNVLIKPAQVHYASPEGQNADLLEAIDRQLQMMKDQPDSVYYKAGDRWLGGLAVRPIDWPLIRRVAYAVIILILGAVALLTLLWNWTLRREFDKRIQAQNQLEHDAYHDALTGLPNRKFLYKKINELLAAQTNSLPPGFALIFIDLDQFKVVNDSLGHVIGDCLLIQIGDRLGNLVSSHDFIARLGGDEFVILLTEMQNAQSVTQFTQWLLKALQKPCWVDDHEVVISGSIGIILETAIYQKATDVIRDADIAMYASKKKGRNCYTIFDPIMRAHANKRLRLENELRKALKQKEFVLHYQPIIELETGALRGFEALLRWQKPDQEILSPQTFIAVAEETGLIVPLGWWVLSEACKQLRSWQTQCPGVDNLRMSVNISVAQLRDPYFLDHLLSLLTKYQISGSCLLLELTESILVESFEAAQALFEELQKHSIHIGIDDFGTGYSSLSYLHQLPISALKIDRIFVSQLDEDFKQQPIIQTILLLAQQLEIVSIAEGIETENQLLKLKQLGCDYGQGYWFGHPLTSEDAERFIHRNLENCA